MDTFNKASLRVLEDELTDIRNQVVRRQLVLFLRYLDAITYNTYSEVMSTSW